MTSNSDMTGALFFSKEEPQITGYLVIGGQHFEIVGWRPSPIRAEISAKPVGEASKGRDAEQPDHKNGSSDNPGRAGARECDPA
jgi:hypothetical protein